MSKMKQQDARVTIRLQQTLLSELIEAATLSNHKSVSEYIRNLLTENMRAKRAFEDGE